MFLEQSTHTLTNSTLSLAANAKMSAQETVPGHTASSLALA